MITTLTIENIECHSYHGCLNEEAIIGGRFSIDVTIEADFTKAIETDELSYAADYVVIHNLVREEMNIPSKLIEHAAGRILKRLADTYRLSQNITVTIKKYNPPVNGSIGIAILKVSLK
jgi:7,8-dihydroneopterin aldolase/epimerase/oxygenase